MIFIIRLLAFECTLNHRQRIRDFCDDALYKSTFTITITTALRQHGAYQYNNRSAFIHSFITTTERMINRHFSNSCIYYYYSAGVLNLCSASPF